MKNLIFIALSLLCQSAYADRLYFSHDIVTNIHADYIGGAYTKWKLVWGDDGVANDISTSSPLPVQFSSTSSVIVNQGTTPWIVFDPTLDLDLISFKTANHSDLTLIDLDLLSFKSANHTDLGTINTSVGTVNTNLLAFKSANHTDLTLIDTDLLAFKSANHADLIATQPRNIAQFGGSNVVTGVGASGSGIPRITVSNDSTAKTPVFHVRNDYSSVNVTTLAYTQLVASTSGSITQLYIFDSSGQTLVLALGAAGVEVDQFYVVPGGDEIVNVSIASGTRISIKAVSATASAGEIAINAFN